MKIESRECTSGAVLVYLAPENEHETVLLRSLAWRNVSAAPYRGYRVDANSTESETRGLALTFEALAGKSI